MKKKFLSTLTALAMVLSMLPVSVFATADAGTGLANDSDTLEYYTFGTYDEKVPCAEGYIALPNLSGQYVVGVEPTATINPLGAMELPGGEYGIYNGSFGTTTTEDPSMPLNFVMQFLADQTGEEAAESPFAEWYADFVITIDNIVGGSFVANGCYLAGYYDPFGWIKVPIDGMKITEGERYPVMMGVNPALGQKYEYICSGVADFQCAMFLTDEVLNANPDMIVTLELSLVDNAQGGDAAQAALASGENIHKVTSLDYDVDDFFGYVAEVDGEKYSLQNAIDAIDATGTITLIDDANMGDGTITIPEGKSITLDLAGHTISQTKNQTGNYSMIQNDGDLTIIDSGEGGKISYTDSGNGGNYVSNTIMNRGKLTLKSGTVENLSSATVASNGYPYAIDTSIHGEADEVNTIIEGGKVYCESYSSMRLRADSETEPVNITIAGGEVWGRIEVQNPSNNLKTVGKLTITDDCYINKNASRLAVMVFGGGGTAENLKVEISGGEFVGAIGYSSYFPIDHFDENVITGGTFSEDVSSFVAENHVVKENSDGTYTVEPKSYTITFDTKGGTEIAPITAASGVSINAPSNPSKPGYTFAGWDKTIPTTMPAENVTITANWTTNQYAITFDTDGGTEIAPIAQDYGTAVKAPENPTKVGYTFVGWDKTIPTTMPDENVTITAKWTINQYTITFVTGSDTVIAPITQDYGTDVNAPEAPTKTGYTFGGWDKTIPTTMPAENVTVTAKWTINQYTIAFDTDGGTEIAPITQNYGATISAPSNPTKAGYTFAGWDKAIPETMPAGNMTIVAQWNPIVVSHLALNKGTTSLTEGGSEQLTAEVGPGEALNKTLTWTSSNTAVATVTSEGRVNAIAPGTATITVATTDGSNLSVTCVVTVTADASSESGGVGDVGGGGGGSSAPTTPVTPPAPSTPVTPPASSEAPTVSTETKEDTETGSTTTTETKSDGTVVETTTKNDGTTTKTETQTDGTVIKTETAADGSSATSSTKTEVKETADGTATTTTTTNATQAADGSTSTETKVEEKVETAAGTTTTTTTTNATQAADGSTSTETKVEEKVETEAGTTTTTTTTNATQAADGATTTETKVEEKVETAAGTTTTTTTNAVKTDAEGKTTSTAIVEEKVETETGATTTTTATTEKADGTTLESKTVAETVKAEDGTEVTTSKNETTSSDGSASTTTVAADGISTTEVTISNTAVNNAASAEVTVVLPMPEVAVATSTETAPTVTVSLPANTDSVKVEIPVASVTEGTVAVIVHADGTEEIVKTSTVGENGVVVDLEDGATVKVVDNSKEFEDVPEDHWASDAVDFNSARGLINGTGEGTYDLDSQLTRAMMTTILASYNSVETTGGSTWYEKGMEWAKETGVSDGTNPDGNITREQLAVMLWRASGSPVEEHNLAFNDGHEISDWAEDAMKWAIKNGIMSGKGENNLDPKGQATRAEAAVMMRKFCNIQ